MGSSACVITIITLFQELAEQHQALMCSVPGAYGKPTSQFLFIEKNLGRKYLYPTARYEKY